MILWFFANVAIFWHTYTVGWRWEARSKWATRTKRTKSEYTLISAPFILPNADKFKGKVVRQPEPDNLLSQEEEPNVIVVLDVKGL